MSKLTPAEATEKHARRLKASLEDVRVGIERVTESPTAKAAAQADKMLARITKSIQDGKWQAGLNRVSLEQWKSAALTKGVNRISQGIDEASDKMTAFYTDLFPHIDRGLEQLKKMPDVTLEDSIARMTFMIRHMAKLKRT